MFKECTDATLKAQVKEVIAEYGKLKDVDEDGLKRIYDMMNQEKSYAENGQMPQVRRKN